MCWYRLVVNPICWCVYLSVGQSVWRLYCGKTTDLIWMQSEVVSGVCRWIGVLDGVEIVEGKRHFWR